MSYIKSNPTTNYLQRNGFIMVSNLLIDYQEELGITDDELVFITKIMKNSSGWRLHDCDISKTVSSKTLQSKLSQACSYRKAGKQQMLHSSWSEA